MDEHATKQYKSTPPVQWTLLTLDNGQVALHEWMLMYCNKPLTTDKRCGYMKIRRGCSVVYACARASSCAPGDAIMASVTGAMLWE